MHRLTLLSIMFAAAVTGCAGTVGYRATASTQAYGPDLVYVSPGVQVIADYDEPIFYADNFYWRFSGGTWYRSSHYTGGWVYASPPSAVVRIERPTAYVHYRPAGWKPNRGRGQQKPEVRDHRQARPAPRGHRR